ncbi:MAG: DUF58 domain-containing protein [Eubacteriales bacterium]|nr:DUF58 domain-containing protein [Eubacteriales bacterium]MDD3882398.1 DUF58 domain-containing protein [Eubacteriales bacterium]MDD4512381.1 DUF58 domain-containing protein [Eubacteriales bacterium]
MTKRGAVTLAIAFTLWICALSTGSPLYLLAAVLLTLMAAYSALSVLLAAYSSRAEFSVDESVLTRGELIHFSLKSSGRTLLPISAPSATVMISPSELPYILTLPSFGAKQTSYYQVYPTRHVGILTPQISSLTYEDIFALFRVKRETKYQPREVSVLPLPYTIDMMEFAKGDTGLETLTRATEDTADPADVREYKAGDSLKKIHWKITARRRELYVRRFEEPNQPEALVLVDPASPGCQSAELNFCFQDAICETAYAAALRHEKADHPVRMPLLIGGKNIDYRSADGMSLQFLRQELARMEFTSPENIESLLKMEIRNLRKTGATIVITSRLSGRIVELLQRIRRMGPTVRLYFVTLRKDDPKLIKYVSRLQMGKVQVCYVLPVIPKEEGAKAQ